MFLGYVAEFKLRSLLIANPEVTSISKPDDHSRKKGDKNDLVLAYKGRPFSFEVKSLQTNSIKHDPIEETYKGKSQVDASDSRTITFPDGTKLVTTNLLIGDFDILAVNLFQFKQEWAFAFALNDDLPRSRHKAYTTMQREQLLATSVDVSLPITPPFVVNPFDLMDLVIERGQENKST